MQSRIAGSCLVLGRRRRWKGHGPHLRNRLCGGDCNDYAKCYYDNEPYSSNHWDSKSVPPIARFCKFVNNGDDTIAACMTYEKVFYGGNQIFDYTNSGCTKSCDGFCKAGNTDSTGAPMCFDLKTLNAIPW